MYSVGVRVVVPEKWRQKLLSELHCDHTGAVKMKGIAHSYMWWPGLDATMAKSCLDCEAMKASSLVALFHPWEWPSRVYEQVHIDFAESLQGTHFLVAIDAFS